MTAEKSENVKICKYLKRKKNYKSVRSTVFLKYIKT